MGEREVCAWCTANPESCPRHPMTGNAFGRGTSQTRRRSRGTPALIHTIRHRATGAPLYSCEAKTLRAAVKQAVLRDANLTGANLADADLAHANLAGADLADADLAGANLAGADLAGADRLLRTIDAGPGSPPEGGFDAPPGAKAFTPRGEAETDTTTEGDET